MNTAKRRITRDTLIFLPAKLLEGFIIMLTTSLYSDLFTLDAYGEYQLVNTSILLIYLISMSWMTNSSARFIGEELRRDKGSALFSTMSVTYTLICLSTLLLSFGAYLISGNPVYIAGALMCASYSLFQIMNASLVQAGLIAWSVCLSLFSAGTKLGAAYLFSSLMSGGARTPYPAIFAAVSADLIAGILAVFALKIPFVSRFRFFSRDLLRRLLSFGIPLIGVSISVGMLNMVDRYLVTFFSGKDALAIYAANYSVSSGVFALFTAAIMRGVYPSVLRAWREDGLSETQPLLNGGARLYLLISAPAAIGLCALSNYISRFMFFSKAEYHTGSPIIALTAIAMFMMGLTEYANKAWELNKKTLPILQNSIVAAVIKVAASAALLPLFGFMGAAYGTVLAFLSYFLLTYIRVRKEFVFHLTAHTVVSIVIACAACGAAAFFVSQAFEPSILGIILSITAGAAAYFIVLSLSGEIKDEIAAFISRFKRAV